ncbi:MAG TPA: hypothetical protein VIO87_05680 [Methylotenera sp.]
MKQIEFSDFPRGNFNNNSDSDVEYSSFSEEHNEVNGFLNDDTKLAEIPGEDFTRELMVRLLNCTQN